MDPKEKRFLIVKERDFEDDIGRLRRRYIDLQGAPKMADVSRFPEKHIIANMIAQNRALRIEMEMRQVLETDRASGFRAAMYENDEILEVLVALQTARSDVYYIDVRRKALKKLLNLLGTESYAAAMLPPATPVWRFQERH